MWMILLFIMLFAIKQAKKIPDNPQDTIVQTRKHLLRYQECSLKIKAYEISPKKAQTGVLLTGLYINEQIIICCEITQQRQQLE